MGPIVTLPDQVWVLGDQTVGPQGKTPINIFLINVTSSSTNWAPAFTAAMNDTIVFSG